MRIIKFRAWDNDLREMHEVAAIYFHANSSLMGNVPYLIDGNNDLHSLADIQLMQFIGLTDKNGKEIFEGDIVELAGNRKRVRTQIEFLNGCFGYWYPDSNEFHTLVAYNAVKDWQIDVIGNVFENPELLEA